MLIMEISWSKLGSLAGWLWHKPQFSNHCLRQKCQSWNKLSRLGCLTWHVYSSWKPNKSFQLSRVFVIHFLFKKKLINYLSSNSTIRKKQNYKCITCKYIYTQMSIKYNVYILLFRYIKTIRFLTVCSGGLSWQKVSYLSIDNLYWSPLIVIGKCTLDN